MRIKLELEDFRFATTRWAGGDTRWLQVVVGGKPFSVWVTLDRNDVFRGLHYGEEVDKSLIAQMEYMLAKILTDACAAIPEGTQLYPKEV